MIASFSFIVRLFYIFRNFWLMISTSGCSALAVSLSLSLISPLRSVVLGRKHLDRGEFVTTSLPSHDVTSPGPAHVCVPSPLLRSLHRGAHCDWTDAKIRVFCQRAVSFKLRYCVIFHERVHRAGCWMEWVIICCSRLKYKHHFSHVLQLFQGPLDQ